jgi:hypothetical protein
MSAAASGTAGQCRGIFMPRAVSWVADRSNLHYGLSLSALARLLMMPLVLALRAMRKVRVS